MMYVLQTMSPAIALRGNNNFWWKLNWKQVIGCRWCASNGFLRFFRLFEKTLSLKKPPKFKNWPESRKSQNRLKIAGELLRSNTNRKFFVYGESLVCCVFKLLCVSRYGRLKVEKIPSANWLKYYKSRLFTLNFLL